MIVEGEWRKVTQTEMDMLLFQVRVQEREKCARVASDIANEFDSEIGWTIAKAIRALND